MKTNIKLPVNPNSHILVDVGEKIEPDTPIAENRELLEEKILHLSRLLHVKEDQIAKFLRKKVGEKISASEIIAEKKGWLSTTSVTTPVSGTIREIDLKKGTLTVMTHQTKNPRKINSPVSGVIARIGKEYIEIEVEGEVIKGLKGEGSDALAVLVTLSGENIGTQDFHKDIENRIVVCHSFSEDFPVKLDVLGASGIVSHNVVRESSLPWLQVDRDQLVRVGKHDGDRALLQPEEKQIICL